MVFILFFEPAPVCSSFGATLQRTKKKVSPRSIPIIGAIRGTGSGVNICYIDNRSNMYGQTPILCHSHSVFCFEFFVSCFLPSVLLRLYYHCSSLNGWNVHMCDCEGRSTKYTAILFILQFFFSSPCSSPLLL